MFDISKFRPKSILGPVKAQKFSWCLPFSVLLGKCIVSTSVFDRKLKKNIFGSLFFIKIRQKLMFILFRLHCFSFSSFWVSGQCFISRVEYPPPLLLWKPTYLNSLRAKFCRGNINIYLHFMSLLHIDMTQVLKILPQVTPGPTYST